ncbi:hypothetical protein, partial [Planomonospora alba]|uniref:hypothetical protein n=1 Tax=Planomonospora alba TaxID=161354 RepID=UPI0031EE0E82
GGGFRDRDDRGGERRPYGDREGGSRTRYGRDEQGDRGETPARQREELPPLAPDITADELDKEIREELRSLPLDLADLISRHLVAAERALEEENPEQAYEHTKVARRFAARIGVIREAVGIAAYRAGHFAEALSDLRAARRMTGSEAFLPVMADCERGLGRPERALDLARSKEAERLDRAGRIEMAIVESGARRDLGQKDAAVITLQRLSELRDDRPYPWSARLAYAYADALADAGHESAATEWFGRAMAFDEDGETDAAERYAVLTGAVIEDLEEDFEDSGEDGTGEAEVAGESAAVQDAEPEGFAVLDEEIEDEVDLDEEDERVIGEIAQQEPAAVEEKAAEEGDAAGTAGQDAVKSGTGVGPAFIEPDFGDVLDDRAGDEENEDKEK